MKIKVKNSMSLNEVLLEHIHTLIYIEIYYKELAHVIMQAGKSKI
jgi:hypothetical protein